MTLERPAVPEKKSKSEKGERMRPYKAPELEEYGSLKELTQTLSNVTPGDGFGASYAI